MYENITSFVEACNDQSLDANNIPDVSNIPEEFRSFVIASFEMAVIAKSLNRLEDGSYWVPDYSDSSLKWEPVFNMPTSSSDPSGFSLHCSLYYSSDSSVGDHLVYRKKEISDFAATQHVETYRKIKLMQ